MPSPTPTATGSACWSSALLASLPLAQFPAARWLQLNRDHWGVDNGLHARLDISRRDDQCRVCTRNGVWVQGIFARLANSLFMKWRGHQRQPRHHSTSDFAALMAAKHGRRVLLTVTARRPNLHSRS